MPEGWEWDDTLFLGSAPYYRRGRLPYAPGLAELLAEVLKLDGRGRLLDVGCGPGVLALGLAHLFGEVVGLDPDGGMIAEAGQLADEAGVARKTRWVRARAEELPAGLGTFTVATFGQSFHWMDRDLVAATVRDMLRPAGALVHIADLKTETLTVDGLPYPGVPYAAIGDLVGRYLGPVRRAGRGVLLYGTPSGEADVLGRAGFSGPERYVVPGGQALERSCDDVLAWVFSTSSSAPHLFGTRRGDFEADLGRLLRETSPAGLFSERQPSTEAFVWREPSAR
ncbi:class I SAM-dependent methyltransferase [Streptomyces scopuliridis]|uniref:Class I SAM-dependent methyltransferase n=1 Tax=Streptomyces scopuliridis TaxID=452529 RepID=A0ACD4ZMD9_9ACTN|nr:class I SAM-dependent methyltransferase [Streptomyces scopuliridis]WSB99345.1 class I SAM-dependent methyltransferase [Streptomyces scopuliridis]WSC06954.1 class I SAM-dependent methyltransferase [Streptomyces scopuliridis]